MSDKAPHTEKPDECHSCSWETEELEEFDAYARTRGHGPFTPDNEKQWAWLCRVCRSTPVGNAYLYPRQHSTDRTILVTIAWGINYLLDALEAKK